MFSGEMIESFLMIAALSAAIVGYGIWAGRKEEAEKSDFSRLKKAS